ncbi:MAG: hypothetical protein OSJ73_11075 [Lachnospiraceae bacterium]|nr:hypothetical protein [Lachnospiraceae bacterium]
MGEVKTKHRKLTITDILYNDTLWIVFYIFNTLYALGRVMVRYNYSSVADSNPISVALHGGFYLVCAMAVCILCMRAKFARCSAMEMLYFGLRIIVLCPQFSETFSYLLAARVICILVGVFMGVTVFKKQYREMDKKYHFRWKVILPVAVLSIVLFVIVYHEYVKQMIWGAVIIAIIAVFGALKGDVNVIPIEDIDSIILKK